MARFSMLDEPQSRSKAESRKMAEVVEMECKTIRSASDAQQLVENVIRRRGWKVLGSARGDILASIGSSFRVRMLGFFVAGENSYPRKMTINFQELERGCQVKIKVEDAMGFGSRAGIANKVRHLMFSDASAIKEELNREESQ